MKSLSLLVWLLGTLFLCFGSAAKAPQDECGSCKTVVDTIEHWLQANATETQIIVNLETICSSVPAFQSVCKEIIALGVPYVVNWIIQAEDPTTFCTQVGLCSNPQSAKPSVFPPKEPIRDGECDLCTYVVGVVEGWIESNATVTEIEQYLDLLCQLIPSMEDTCDAIVAEGVPEVVAWLQNEFSPQQVCQMLGLCSSLKVKPAMPALGDTECDICTYIVSTLEGWIASNATVAEIEQYLDKLCELIPAFENACDAIVAQGVPDIVEWLEQKFTPQEVCQELGLCSSRSEYWKNAKISSLRKPTRTPIRVH